jgi:hypothetical protein
MFSYIEKIGDWDSLQVYKESIQISDNIMAGDFNTVTSSKEKGGGNVVRDPMRERTSKEKERGGKCCQRSH